MYSRLLLIFALTSGTAFAQATSLPAEQESVQTLIDRIQQLEKRISELEDHQRKQDAGAVANLQQSTEAQASQDNATFASPLHSEHAVSTTAIREAEMHYPSLQIRGFADVDFSATNEKGSVSGFNLGQFVLHLASPLSKKVGYFGELSFTARPTGYDVQVERTIIRYDYNDYFKISFGKYHTPLGYWNISMLLGNAC